MGREGFQGPCRKIPDPSGGRAFQTKERACAKALRHGAEGPLGELCMQRGVRSQGCPAGERLERRTKKMHGAVITQSRGVGLFPEGSEEPIGF